MSAHPSPEHGVPEATELRHRAQDSVREWVASASAHGEASRKWVVPLAVGAGMAAAVCAPVVWPLLAAGTGSSAAAVGAALSQVGGVGGGLLAEAVLRAWDRLRSAGRADAGQAELRGALSVELETALTLPTPAAAALRDEVAKILHRVDAVQVALTATVEESAASLRADLVRGLRELGEDFTEFGWVLGEVNEQLAVIAEGLAQSAAVSREVADNQQQTLVELAMLRREARRAYLYRTEADTPETPTGLPDDEEQAAVLDAARAAASTPCPYLGLAAFQPIDAERFFGRDQLTATLVTRSAGLLAQPGLLMVLGPSGSGKSSLLRAGLLPAVAAGALPARESWAWPRDLMTPGRRPLLELATRIASVARIPAGALEADLRADPSRIIGAIRQALLAGTRRQANATGVIPVVPDLEIAGQQDQESDDYPFRVARQDASEPRLVLIVDQFEELFTQCPDEDERRIFVMALCAAAGVAAPGTNTGGTIRQHAGAREAPALVVMGIRADFYARCTAYPELVPQLQDNQVLVGPLDEAGVRDAIEKPASAVGLIADPALVEVLLADLGPHAPPPGLPAGSDEEFGASTASTGWDSYAAGRLALLSYALQQTWRNREARRLTVAGYRATGGIDGAIAQAADHVYRRLDPAGQETLRRVLLRLVTLGDGTPDTRRRVTGAELAGPENSEPAALTRVVLSDLIEARLVTADVDTLEITHETLLTAWPRLRRWLTEDRAGLRTHRDLTEAARDWEHEKRDPGRLFRGTRLAVALDWAAHHSQDLNAGEEAFLAASQRHQLRTIRLRRAGFAALAVLALIAVTTAGVAVHYATRADRQQAIALSRQLAADSLGIDQTEPITARQLAVAAWRVSQTSQARSAITTLLTEQQENGILPADRSGVNGVTFSPDGRLLASADADGYVRLWNPATGQPVRAPLPADPGIPNGVSETVFSPDGRLLASADADGYVRLWNPATGQPAGTPLPADPGTQNGVNEVAFSPNGRLLASADADGYVRLWNPATGQPVGAPLRGSNGGGVNEVAFSPDARLLASAGADGAVRLWNPVTHQPVGSPLRGSSSGGAANEVAFSPNGALLTYSGGTVRLWNPFTHQPAGAPVHVGSEFGVAFSPDGLLATAGGDGTVRLWNPVSGHPVGVPLQASADALDPLSGVTFSPDGKLLASSSADGTVRLWDPVTGRPAGAPRSAGRGRHGGVSGVAFSPDGKLLAGGYGDGTVRLWDPVTGRLVRTLMHPNSADVTGVAFSPRGKLLASAHNDGTMRLWNPVTGHPVGAPRHASTGIMDTVSGVAFSPHGKLLASADGDGTVRLWDPVTGRLVRTLIHPSSADVSGVAFSPGGKLLASADLEGTVRLWNPVTGRAAGPPIPADTGTQGGVNGVAFSPDGKLLASADVNGTVRLWNPVTGRAVGAPLPADRGNQDGVEGVAFSPDGKLLASADADGYVRLWNPVTGRAVGAPLPADPGPLGGVIGVTFKEDGTQLASADANGTVLQWSTWLFESPYAALCADVGPPAHSEWARYAPGESQPSVCSSRQP
jgi:WD40 repeat protein